MILSRYKLVKVSIVKTFLVISCNAFKAVNLSVSFILVPVSFCVEISITWRSRIWAKSVCTEKCARNRTDRAVNSILSSTIKSHLCWCNIIRSKFSLYIVIQICRSTIIRTSALRVVNLHCNNISRQRSIENLYFTFRRIRKTFVILFQLLTAKFVCGVE